MRFFRIFSLFLALVLTMVCSMGAVADEGEQKQAINPVRLSYVNGAVSFWRYGAEDWAEARINTPLAAGDALYVGKDSELELQSSGRAFIRADDDTQLSLVNQTADYLQIKITAGRVSLDLRTLPAAGFLIEVDTPNAVFHISRTGYYRFDVDGDVHFITRRGGQATMTPAGGEAMSVRPSEEIVIQGGDMARAETYVAPPLDQWDYWNYDRTNELSEVVSDRYLPSGVAGAYDLDHYGSWRVTPEYGPVWVPDSVPYGWAPYSTGRWIWDPYYQWTWIDDAPWGWAPFHYGRWVYLGGYWAWAPGSVAVGRPVYSPALVAFFGVTANVSIGIRFNGPGVGWIALSWGEPLIPWWGPRSFIGRPWWGGWGGPRVVNQVIVKQTTVVNVSNITYANTRIRNSIVAIPSEHFGRGDVREAPYRLRAEEHELSHVRGALPVKPSPVSLLAGPSSRVRPPEQVWSRPVVATRRPPEARLPWRAEAPIPVGKIAEPRYQSAPRENNGDLQRPEFGTQTGPERERPPLPPRYNERRRQTESALPPGVTRDRREAGRQDAQSGRAAMPEAATPSSGVREPSHPAAAQEGPRRGSRKDEAAQQETRQKEKGEQDRSELPGKPANRIYKGHEKRQGERRRSQPAGD